MTCLRRFAFLVACLGSLRPAVAVAEGVAPASTQARSAEELASKAFEAYSRQDFPSAVALYIKAYQAEPRSEILFNIARIYDVRMQDRELAQEFYRRYLRSADAEPELVKRATERLSALKKEAVKPPLQSVPSASIPASAETPAASPPPVVTPAPPDAPQGQAGRRVENGSSLRTAGFVVGGIGLASVAVGTAFGVAALGKRNEAAAYCAGLACRDARGVDLSEQGRTAAAVSTTGFVVGGLALATGIVLYAVAPKSQEAKALRFEPHVGTQIAGLSVTGRWQ